MGLAMAMITPWNVRCGIFTYSRSLVKALATVGVDVYVVKYPRFGIRTPELLQSMVLDKIPLNQIDMVHVQHEYGLFYPNLESSFFAGLKALQKPIVTTMHAVGMRAVDKLVSDTSNAVVVHNQFCARHFQNGKCIVIPHGCEPVECPPKEECKKALGIDPHVPIVGYQGFISPQKGLETLIEAMAKVRGAALLIGGGWHVETETDYISRLKQWSLEALRGRCQWLGYVPDERLKTVYGAMDVFVYPSAYASESGALLTALSHGKAVVASDVPPFKEKEGALVTFKDIDDLASKINRYLKCEEDRRKLEEAAFAYAKAHSWKIVAEKHLTLYQHILERAKANG